jgi:hypothetical protein
MVAVGRDGGVWQRVNRKERCPICGHDSWCGMIVGELVACMRKADGAKFSKPGKDGQIRHYHDWPDRAVPIPIRPQPERPADWAAPAATTCRALYTAIVARYAARPHSKACDAEATRRFGDRALDALAAADYCEIDERDLFAWLDAEGRVADAKSAGILADDGKLAPALKGRKVYAFRLPNGEVANLRGRDLTGRSPLKVLDLAGGYEERGADAGLYHAERVADVADGVGWLHLAGGCEKADALIAAGFCAVSTPGEGTLFDAALADLTARRVLSVAVWVDAEDPKAGETLSAGRRLGLAVTERLAAAGMSVRVVEPAREPGAPKRDADGILRDGGPGALWDCWAASEDLAAFRARVGADDPGDGSGALVDDLRAQLHVARADRDRERAEKEEVIALMRAVRGVLANRELKQEGRVAIGLAFEFWERRDRPETKRLPDQDAGVWLFQYRPGDVAESIGVADDAVTESVKRLKGWGRLRAETKTRWQPNPETGEDEFRRDSFLHIDAPTIPAWLEPLATFKPTEEQCAQVGKRAWGGHKRYACPRHPEAVVRYEVRAVCTACEAEVGRHDTHRDGEGREVAAPPTDADFRATTYQPEVPVTRDTVSGCGLPPTPDGSVQSQPEVPGLSRADSNRTVRCLSASRGCVNRVAVGVEYCAECEADDWRNRRGASDG